MVRRSASSKHEGLGGAVRVPQQRQARPPRHWQHFVYSSGQVERSQLVEAAQQPLIKNYQNMSFSNIVRNVESAIDCRPNETCLQQFKLITVVLNTSSTGPTLQRTSIIRLLLDFDSDLACMT